MKLFKKKWAHETSIFEVTSFVDKNGNTVPTFEECTIVMVCDRRFGVCHPHSAKMFNNPKVGDLYLEATVRYPLPTRTCMPTRKRQTLKH